MWKSEWQGGAAEQGKKARQSAKKNSSKAGRCLEAGKDEGQRGSEAGKCWEEGKQSSEARGREGKKAEQQGSKAGQEPKGSGGAERGRV